jgi:DNA-directed RNA polymerase II subunit RPB1
LKPEDETVQDKATHYSKMIEYTKMVDIVKSVQICFDPNDKATNIIDDELLMEQYYEFENMMKDCMELDADEEELGSTKWIIRMEFNAETMLDKNITMDDVNYAIKNSEYGDDMKCVYSDYNADNLIFRIRLNSSVFNKSAKKVKGVPEALDQSDHIHFLREYQDKILNNIVLRGLDGITNVMPRKLQNMVVKDESKYTRKDTWILDTTGTNLMSCLAMDFIDFTRTISNDIKEVYDVLGIEAAREIIYNEFVDVMEFSGVYINYHHLSLLCDRMTSNKDMVSIFRSGILNDNIGPISKSTFEVHTEVLLTASRHAEFDHMRGVSASVMMGQTGTFGTGSFQVLLDMERMNSIQDEETSTKDQNKEINRMFGSLEDSNASCSKKSVEIVNNVASIKQDNVNNCDDDDYDAGF